MTHHTFYLIIIVLKINIVIIVIVIIIIITNYIPGAIAEELTSHGLMSAPPLNSDAVDRKRERE
jgi:uncharacterized protein YneF (UPF0154 family)